MSQELFNGLKWFRFFDSFFKLKISLKGKRFHLWERNFAGMHQKLKTLLSQCVQSKGITLRETHRYSLRTNISKLRVQFENFPITYAQKRRKTVKTVSLEPPPALQLAFIQGKRTHEGRHHVLTFLYNLIQVWSPLESEYCRPKNHTSLNPMVLTTWSKSCFPVVVCWMANSSSASIVVTRTFICGKRTLKWRERGGFRVWGDT